MVDLSKQRPQLLLGDSYACAGGTWLRDQHRALQRRGRAQGDQDSSAAGREGCFGPRAGGRTRGTDHRGFSLPFRIGRDLAKFLVKHVVMYVSKLVPFRR